MVQAKEDSNSDYNFAFIQAHVGIPKTWLLLDSESIVNMFMNEKLLMNIREVDSYVTMYGNNRVSKMNIMRLLIGYGDTWLDKNGIANVLAKSDAFEVHKPNKILLFHEYKNGLHYHNMTKRSTQKEGKVQEPENNVSLLNNVTKTVEGNKEKLLAWQVEAASKERKLDTVIGFPSDSDFKNM
eukprot:5235257-Ditylum_brightwellii.AAC.1